MNYMIYFLNMKENELNIIDEFAYKDPEEKYKIVRKMIR